MSTLEYVAIRGSPYILMACTKSDFHLKKLIGKVIPVANNVTQVGPFLLKLSLRNTSASRRAASINVPVMAHRAAAYSKTKAAKIEPSSSRTAIKHMTMGIY